MKTACWLMDRFGVSEAIAGDLVEQFQGGRPTAWLLRQTLGAIVMGVVEDVGTHPFLVLRAVLMGLVLREANLACVRAVEASFDARVGEAAVELFNLSGPAFIVVLSLANALMAAPVWFFIGWSVARVHRNRHVLVLVATVWMLVLPHYVRQIAHTFGETTIRPNLLTVQLTTIGLWMGLFTVSVVAGAMATKETPGALTPSTLEP